LSWTKQIFPADIRLNILAAIR